MLYAPFYSYHSLLKLTMQIVKNPADMSTVIFGENLSEHLLFKDKRLNIRSVLSFDLIFLFKYMLF